MEDKQYFSVREIVEFGMERGIKISLNGLKLRIDSGRVPGAIRDENSPKNRRLIPREIVPFVMKHYEKLADIRARGYTLIKLARDCSIDKKYVHELAKELGIKTKKIGNYRVIEKSEYDKWRIYFGAREKYEKNYVTTGFIGRAWGISHFLVDYYIKRGIIPGKKIGKRYFISRDAFNTEGERWKDECLNKTCRKKALEEKI